jgi:hypothetical protein
MWKLWRKRPSSNGTMNRAYLVYAEWGPNRSIPRDERLRHEFPQSDVATRKAWIAEFDRINHKIFALAEQGGPITYSLPAFSKLMRLDFPWMDDQSLSFAHTVMGYYAFVDGYA